MLDAKYKIITLEDYEKYIGGKAIERISNKAKSLQNLHIANINSTYYGGGVAALLSSLSLLFNSIGIKTGWRIIQGSPDFFSITKKMHNALQGGKINLSKLKKRIYEKVIEENAIRNHLDHDLIIIHDPQPLPMINYYKRKAPWIWRCHIDLSSPNKTLWIYLKQFIEKYDAVVFSLKEYQQELKTPQFFFQPAIDPFCVTNADMTEKEINDRLDYYDIPQDLPIIAQVSRFDKWKDPLGVIEAFKIAQKEIDATLVLLGNIATDDPEGEKVYESLLNHKNERIIILIRQDSALVNALQRRASVVLQKSIKEGFGLTVAEAMWKGAVVVGGKVGGIKYQIKDGENGFLVSSVDETARRIIQLLKNKQLRIRLGKNAKETVRKNFLLPFYMDKYLDLFNAFEHKFILKK
jgi:trehalose synthase